jgi:hypothetical protein
MQGTKRTLPGQALTKQEQNTARNTLLFSLSSRFDASELSKLTVDNIKNEIASKEFPQEMKTALEKQLEVWLGVRTDYLNHFAAEGVRELFISSVGKKLKARDINRSINTATSAQVKAAAGGGGLSSEKLALRNTLAAMLATHAGYTPGQMRTLTFAALDKKINSLSGQQQDAVLMARNAWHEAWAEAPGGAGKKANCVFVTNSGGMMQPAHFTGAINTATNAQAKAAAGGGLSM